MIISNLKVLEITENSFENHKDAILEEIDLIIMSDDIRVKFFYMTEFKSLREHVLPFLKPGGRILTFPKSKI